MHLTESHMYALKDHTYVFNIIAHVCVQRNHMYAFNIITHVGIEQNHMCMQLT